MPGAQFKYLRPEDIRRLSTFEFAPKAVVEGYFAGRHRSHTSGSSIEFRDYREYVPGDNPALIDWRVYGRTDRRYIRTYEQETNTECHIFLDSSASMGFGKKITKLDYASFFAAALCYLVVRNTDRVSLEIFDDKIRHFSQPGSTRKHLHNLLNVLERNEPGGTTSLAEALRRSFPLLRSKGTLIVLSDFFDDANEIFEALSLYLHRGFKVHLFHVLTKEERELEGQGLRTFVDMEHDDRVVVHSDSLASDYQREMAQHIAALRATAARKQIDYCIADTDTSFYELFDRFSK